MACLFILISGLIICDTIYTVVSEIFQVVVTFRVITSTTKLTYKISNHLCGSKLRYIRHYKTV